MKKGIRTVYTIGEKYENKWGDKYKIIGYTDNVNERIIEFESGCIKKVLKNSIKEKEIKDFNHNTFYGVACLGMENACDHYLFWRWLNMIGRCYNQKHCQYKSYGDKGIYVEEYLRNFSNYINVVENLENASKLKEFPKEWQIDKDLKSIYDLCYSRNTLTIMKASENLELENKGKRVKVYMFSLNNELVNIFNSINEAERITGVHRGNIARTMRGESRTAGGHKWRNKNDENEVTYVKQL